MSLKRRIASRLNRSPLIDSHVYTARHGPSKGLRRQGGLGWLPALVPRPHEWDAEEAFLAALDWEGRSVYDVGSDQGLFTLFFADRVGPAGRVIAFEPNPRSYERTRRNVELNGFANVKVLQFGVAEHEETIEFAFPPFEPARGRVANAQVEGVPNLLAEEELAKDWEYCRVAVNSLDKLIRQHRLPVPDFIKLDVEGMECPALKGMTETLRLHRPTLSIEIHGAGPEGKLRNVRNVVTFLEDIGYRMTHIESNQLIGSGNAGSAIEGHLYCEPFPS